MSLSHTLLVSAFGGALFAQSVSTSLTAITPLSCSLTTGSQVSTQSAPAGPLAGWGQLVSTGAPANPDRTFLTWSGGATPNDAQFHLDMRSFLTVADSANVDPGEILVTFAGNGPGPLPVRFEASAVQQGFPSVFVQIDVDNDGTIDWQAIPGTTFGDSAPDITATPLAVRIAFRYVTVQPGNAHFALDLRIVPDNGIYITPIATDCGLYNGFEVETFFDTTLADLVTRSNTSSWHVLGLQAQPSLLPSALTLTGLPCMLVPAPDGVVRTGTWFLAIPAGLRPLTLYAQSVDFLGGGLRVSDAYLIAAF